MAQFAEIIGIARRFSLSCQRLQDFHRAMKENSVPRKARAPSFL
jgi:hypothetical protein